MTNEEIFNNNVNIAYKIANRYMTNYYEEMEDIRQIALMELWRCVESWDHVHALTTYAYLCIPNKINMYLRHVRRHEKNISINTVVYSDGDGNDQTILDLIEDPDDCIFKLLNNIDAKEVLNNICFTEKEKQVINLRIEGLSQEQVGKIMNLSQAQISRIQIKIKNKIGEYIDGKEITTLKTPSLM